MNLIRYIDGIKKILLKNKKNEKSKFVNDGNYKNNQKTFSEGLRKYSEELELIDEINSDPLKIFEMSDEEIDNALQVIKKRNEFLDQRIFELRQELLRINKKDN